MANIEVNDLTADEETLTDDVKKIIGGVATIVLIVVPFILIRKLVKKIEQSEPFKAVENKLG